VERTDERWIEPDLHRVQGELLLAAGGRQGREDAEAAFRRAIEHAEDLNTKAWELRAACSLARLWAEQGKRREAHDLLAPIHGWFTEGIDTRDLKDATALLDALA
jgi:predicted ATPase